MKEWLNFLVLLFEPSLLMSTNCDNVVFSAALSFFDVLTYGWFCKIALACNTPVFRRQRHDESEPPESQSCFSRPFPLFNPPALFDFTRQHYNNRVLEGEQGGKPVQKKTVKKTDTARRYLMPHADENRIKAFWEREEFIMWGWLWWRGMILEKGKSGAGTAESYQII